MPTRALSLRLDTALLDRAAALAPHLDAPTLGGTTPTRSTVLRLALVRGLEVMEAEYKTAKPPRKAR
jgi:hypothetical protein